MKAISFHCCFVAVVSFFAGMLKSAEIWFFFLSEIFAKSRT